MYDLKVSDLTRPRSLDKKNGPCKMNWLNSTTYRRKFVFCKHVNNDATTFLSQLKYCDLADLLPQLDRLLFHFDSPTK